MNMKNKLINKGINMNVFRILEVKIVIDIYMFLFNFGYSLHTISH